MKRISLILGCLFLSFAIPAYSAKEAVIENDYVKMVFSPEEGGVCKSFVYKPTNKELAYADIGYGLFRDQFWAPSPFNYSNVYYEHEIKKTPETISIHLWGKGQGAIYSFTEIHKTITLFSDKPLIRVDYEIKNEPFSFTDFVYAPWFHNFLGVKGETNTYFAPTTDGINEVVYDPAAGVKSEDIWLNNPARGWLAVVGKSKTGVVCGLDYRYLKLFYYWLGAPTATFEWRYHKVKIDCDKSFQTTYYLMPFTGLDRIDGFFDGIAASMALPDKVNAGEKIAPPVSFIAAGDKNLVVKFRYKVLPQEKWQSLGEKQVLLKNNTLSQINPPKEAALPSGTVVFNCQVCQGNKVLGEIERPITIGNPSGKYVLAPIEKQIKEYEDAQAKTDTKPEYKLSYEIVSPHVPWAKPYFAGTIKALILTDDFTAREIVELGERVSLDIETVKFLWMGNEHEYPYVGDRSIRNLDDARKRLKEKLKKEYDVIILSGIDFTRHFDEDIQKGITEKVKNGTSLILIAPVGLKGELAELPFSKGAKKGQPGFLQPGKAHFITSGIPYEILPQIKTITYDNPAAPEQVLLGTDKVPILSLNSLGKGKVLIFTYDVFSHDLTYMAYAFSRITPLIVGDYPLYSPADFAKTKSGETIFFNYWEYFYSLLAKGVIWATGKEPNILIPEFKAEGQNLKINLSNLKEKKKIKLQVTYRNKYSREEIKIGKDYEITPGENLLQLPLYDNLTAGVNLIDLQILDKDNKAINWASTFVYHNPALEIKNVQLDKKIIPASENPIIKGTVNLTGQMGTDYACLIKISDYGQRLIYEKTQPATELSVPFEIQLQDTLTVPFTVSVQLKNKEKVIDERLEKVFVLKKRDWNKLQYHYSSWDCGTSYGWGQLAYLTGTAQDQLTKLGLDNYITNAYLDAIKQPAENNFHFTPLGFCSLIDAKYGDKKNNYLNTFDKKYLVREPSLSDPVFRETVKKNLQNLMKDSLIYGGAQDYCLNDEMSLTYYNDYFDFDFSEINLKLFRAWLQKNYRDLTSLNGQWETDYKTWEEIMPLTLKEAKERPNANYSPWSDFRTFMDDTFADFCSFLQQSAEELDPEAKLSISGTQAPKAGSGMDWWKICHSLKFLHSYNTADSSYMHQSFSRDSGMLISPYRSGDLWWCAFYETYGTSLWHTPSLFNSDYTLNDFGKTTQKQIQEFNSGIWPLLRSAQRNTDRIALHYSQPTIQGTFITGQEKEAEDSRHAWITLLHDCGYQFDFVAYAQLETPDFLEKNGYKILILSQSLALSDKEAGEIKKFISAGGTVLADNACGWMDNHCRTLSKGQLDELFGLKVNRQVSPKTEQLTLAEDWGRMKKTQVLTGINVTNSVTPATARPIISAPEGSAVYLNNYGKGKAIYLNLSLARYNTEREMNGPNEKIFRELLTGCLQTAEIRPRAEIESADSKDKMFFHGHLVNFADGNAQYLGILSESAYNAKISLPGIYHIYDVRQQKYLGKQQNINAVMSSGEAKLYALTRDEIESPALNLNADVVPGEKVNFTIEIPKPRDSNTVMQCAVYNPKGDLCRHYSSPYIIKPGQTKIEGSFTLALNDPSGNWTVKVTELVSGKTASRQLRVK